jgi:hypothetical protein
MESIDLRLFDTPVENGAFAFLVLGFAAFALFCRTRGLFAEDAYYSVVGRAHFRFALVTAGAFIFWAVIEQLALAATALHAIAVFVLFFLLHYGFFHQGIGLVKKSVSLNLLLKISQCPGIRLETLLQSYADGRGAEFLLESRLKQMQALGWVECSDDIKTKKWALTARGTKVGRWYQRLKYFFGLQSPFEKGGSA